MSNLWKWLKAEFNWRVLGKRYDVRLSEEAQRQFDELPEHVREKFMKTMERIGRNPYSGDRIGLDEEMTLRRAPFELVCEWLKEKGITDRKRAREILDELIELGLAEGDDEVGYILTERGVVEAEKKIYDSFGVV